MTKKERKTVIHKLPHLVKQPNKQLRSQSNKLPLNQTSNRKKQSNSRSLSQSVRKKNQAYKYRLS